jgi:hypothetical protein
VAKASQDDQIPTIHQAILDIAVSRRAYDLMFPTVEAAKDFEKQTVKLAESNPEEYGDLHIRTRDKRFIINNDRRTLRERSETPGTGRGKRGKSGGAQAQA